MTYPVQSNHPLVLIGDFATLEDYVIFLIHRKAYEHASAICKGRSILDWGCNNGYGLSVLARTALRVGGLDTNERCVQEARLRYPEFANNIWLYEGREIPFPKRDWDVVISFQVIEHVQDLKAYLEAILSVLSDAGVVLFTTPNREIRLDTGMTPWNKFHATEFTAAELRKVLQEHFCHVEVYGLQGEPEITGIERDRCWRARRAARKERAISTRVFRYLQGAMKSAVRSVLPAGAMARLRHLNQSPPLEVIVPRLPDSVIERFSTSQIYYAKSDLNTAVDLLAVCSNREIQ
jgi:SAM-dependent methyltransferase